MIVNRLNYHFRSCLLCAVSEDLLAVAPVDGGLQIYDVSAPPSITKIDELRDLALHDMTAVSEEMLAATVPTKKHIHFLTFKQGRIEFSKTLPVEIECLGIDNDGKHLFVTTKEMLIIIDFEGNVLRKVQNFTFAAEQVRYDYGNGMFYFYSRGGDTLYQVTPEGEVKCVIKNIPSMTSLSVNDKTAVYIATEKGVCLIAKATNKAVLLKERHWNLGRDSCWKDDKLYVMNPNDNPKHIDLAIFKFSLQD